MEEKDRPLNELKPQDYLDDYKLYLSVEDMPADQRNLTTYFAEFEHQEGEIKAWKKGWVTARMASEYMNPLHAMVCEMEEAVKRHVREITKGECDVYKGDRPIPKTMSHEEIQAWVEGYVEAIKRGIEKGGYTL